MKKTSPAVFGQAVKLILNRHFILIYIPRQKEMESLKIKPDSASFNSSMGEFILDYDEVRKSSSPGELLLEFFNSTYHESAKLAGWDLKSLKTRRPG